MVVKLAEAPVEACGTVPEIEIGLAPLQVYVPFTVALPLVPAVPVPEALKVTTAVTPPRPRRSAGS